jgi:hypothetical protein
MGKTGMDVTEFKPLKSVKNLYLGVPSADFFSTNMRGAAYSDDLGVMTHFCNTASNSFFTSSCSAYGTQ